MARDASARSCRMPISFEDTHDPPPHHTLSAYAGSWRAAASVLCSSPLPGSTSVACILR